MFSLKNVLIVLIIVIFISSFLTSCKFSKIIDLVHKDTDTFYKKYDFSDSRLKKYQVNGIIFIPYTRQLPHRSYSDKFHYYYLSLASYRKKGDDGKVIINNVELEGVKEVKFKKITKELKQGLEFKEYEKNNGIYKDEFKLIHQINDYNMELTDKSQIKVVLNVSVEEDGEVITRDLEYIFETRIREYLVQR